MTEKEEAIMQKLKELLTKMDEKKQERILLLAEDAVVLCKAERSRTEAAGTAG